LKTQVKQFESLEKLKWVLESEHLKSKGNQEFNEHNVFFLIIEKLRCKWLPTTVTFPRDKTNGYVLITWPKGFSRRLLTVRIL